MADSDIFASILGAGDLNAYRDSALGANIFANLGPAISGYKFNTQTWSPSERLWGTGLQAFLGAALGQYGRNQVANETAQIASILPQLYRDPIGTAMPEGLDAEAFSKLRTNLAIKNVQRQAVREQKMQDLMLDLFGKQAEANFGADAAGRKILAENMAYQLLGGGGKNPAALLNTLPENLRGKAAEELAAATTAENVEGSVAGFFDRAKKVGSLKALIPGTDAANEISGVRSGLELLVNKAAGREINEGSRKALMDALPDWNDSVEQLQQKQSLFTDMIRGLRPATPLLDSAGGGARITPTEQQLRAQQGLATQQPAASAARDIIAQVKAQYGDTPEARAIAKQRIEALAMPTTPSGAPYG